MLDSPDGTYGSTSRLFLSRTLRMPYEICGLQKMAYVQLSQNSALTSWWKEKAILKNYVFFRITQIFSVLSTSHSGPTPDQTSVISTSLKDQNNWIYWSLKKTANFCQPITKGETNCIKRMNVKWWTFTASGAHSGAFSWPIYGVPRYYFIFYVNLFSFCIVF